MPEDNSKNALKYFLVLFALSILMVVKLLWPFLSVLILSLLLTNIFRPVHRLLSRYFSGQFASLVTCVLIILLVFIPLTYFVVALSQDGIAYFKFMKGINFAAKSKELIQDSAIFQKIQGSLASYGITLNPENLGNHLASLAKEMGGVVSKISAWAANIINFIVGFSLMILVIFFLLTDFERLAEFFRLISPLPEEQGRQLIEKFQEIAQAIIVGNGICGIIQGTLGGLLFFYFGLDSPILWGSFMAVMAFLPIVGIGAVLLPTALLFLLKGSIAKAAFTAVFYLVLSLSMEYLIKPKLVGRQVKMHTLVVFLAIIGGLSNFGVLGIIYGPLIITAFLTLADIYVKNYAE